MEGSDLFNVVTEDDSIRIIELELPLLLDPQEFDTLNTGLLGTVDEAPGGQFIIDLSKVSYLGSAMLGMMVNIRQRVKQADGMLVLCGMSERLLAIFEACCMERLFKIVRTRADGIRLAKRS